MNANTSPDSIFPRTSFGDVGQRQTLLNNLIVKYLEPEVHYEPTPQNIQWISEMGGGSQKVSISWDGDPRNAESLKSLSLAFHKTIKKIGFNKLVCDDQKLQKLENSIFNLIKTFELLHSKGWSAGYCHPENIFIQPDGDVFLADLGFSYHGEPDGVFAPSWIKSDSKYSFYWKNDRPEIRQARPGATVDFKNADTALLSRIILAVISGQFESNNNSGQIPNLSSFKKYHAVLNMEHQNGKTTTIQVLKALFEKLPVIGPVDHGSNETTQKPKKILPVLITLVVLCVLGTLFYFKFFIPKPPVDSTPPIPKVTSDKDLEKLYIEAKNCSKETRLDKYSALLNYPKNSNDKSAKVNEIHGLIFDESLASLQEFDEKVQSNPLLEYPISDEMEKLSALILRLQNLSSNFPNEDLSRKEIAFLEFTKRRVQELRRE